MTAVLSELASALGQKGQDANVALAQKIAARKDNDAITALVQALLHKTKPVRHDCIKTLYETAAIDPALLVPHAATFLELLTDKDNRMQWGAMTALSAMAQEIAGILYTSIDRIINVAGSGSVITRDHAVRILVMLFGQDAYKAVTLPLLAEQLLQSPPNQVPSYAEQAFPVMDAAHKALFEKTLRTRLQDIEQDSKRKRVEKVLKKI